MHRRPLVVPMPQWRFFRCPSVDSFNLVQIRSMTLRWIHRRCILCTIGSSDALGFAGPRTPFHLTRQRALRVSLTGPFSFLLHANPLARCAASYSPPNHAARRRRSAPPPRTRSALPPQPAPLHPCSSHYAGLAARCLASTHHDLCRRLPRRRTTTFSQPIPFL